jgi:hypothetical protein
VEPRIVWQTWRLCVVYSLVSLASLAGVLSLTYLFLILHPSTTETTPYLHSTSTQTSTQTNVTGCGLRKKARSKNLIILLTVVSFRHGGHVKGYNRRRRLSCPTLDFRKEICRLLQRAPRQSTAIDETGQDSDDDVIGMGAVATFLLSSS